ncbi:MAG: DNA repair protein RadC [Pseudomonadales bacterium]|nr:DNA repair protein RadC [Pseudomonadales bacterium]
MAITDWPEQDRPREKMLQQGPTHLSDSELVAVFLRTGVAGASAVDVSRELLSHFGTLRGMLDAPLDRFEQVKGVGPAKYVLLQAALEIGRRYLQESMDLKATVQGPEHAKRYLMSRLRHEPHEVFAGLFLDSQHRLIGYQELFRGTIDGASVYPREVVRKVMELNAAAVIFAHNHPSGVAEPSDADVRITKRLAQALALVEASVLDHMIVGDSEVISLAERGLM